MHGQQQQIPVQQRQQQHPHHQNALMPTTTFQSQAACKRRKTSSIIGDNEHHSRNRGGHQMHSHHSHEISGGESADGSRPGTPLCDERPDVMIPADPRRNIREKYGFMSNGPLYLPLPRFGAQLLQQRMMSTSHSLTSNQTSLCSSLSSPPPALLTRPPPTSSIPTSLHSQSIPKAATASSTSQCKYNIIKKSVVRFRQ